MDLRVTFQTMVGRALVNTRLQTDRLGTLQEQASTGKRINAVSDDPLNSLSVLAAKAQDDRLSLYLTNIQDARAVLDVANSALREAGTQLARAQQIAIEGSHSGNTPAALESLAQEVDGVLGQMLSLANTQYAGRYVFSGTASNTAPFAVSSLDSEGRPEAVSYQGSLERALAPVAQRLNVATLYTGQEVFQQRSRGTTVYMGSTGASAGTGTDSATGSGTLLVQHSATAYAPGSGVQAGMGSPLGDTILGPSGTHRLTLNDTSGTGAAGTVSLNGGPPISLPGAGTNLMVTGPQGETVFLDTSGITPGFNGMIDITADGTLSLDGGITTVPLTFNANQAVTNSTSGAVTNVNSTAIRRAGSDHLEYQGTNDVFQSLIALRDDLRNTRGLNSREQAEAVSQRLSDLNRVRTGILGVVGEQGVDLQNLDGLEKRAADVQLELRKLTADLEGVDLSKVVLELQSQQNLLQLTLAATARLFDQSLLNFIGP